jgi:hypothetical protein
MKLPLSPTLIASLVLLSFTSEAPAAAPKLVTGNSFTSFSMVLNDPSESIQVTGKLHVTTQVEFQDEGAFVQLHANVADAAAVGLSTGRAFKVGMEMFTSQQQASLEYLIANASLLLKGDVANDLSQISKKLTELISLKLKFSAAGQLLQTEIAPFEPCLRQ